MKVLVDKDEFFEVFAMFGELVNLEDSQRRLITLVDYLVCEHEEMDLEKNFLNILKLALPEFSICSLDCEGIEEEFLYFLVKAIVREFSMSSFFNNDERQFFSASRLADVQLLSKFTAQRTFGENFFIGAQLLYILHKYATDKKIDYVTE